MPASLEYTGHHAWNLPHLCEALPEVRLVVHAVLVDPVEDNNLLVGEATVGRETERIVDRLMREVHEQRLLIERRLLLQDLRLIYFGDGSAREQGREQSERWTLGLRGFVRHWRGVESVCRSRKRTRTF